MTTSSEGGGRPGAAPDPARPPVGPLATTEELCAVRRDVLGHVGNKWTALVLTVLQEEPLRYSELRRSCRISQRMLTLTLRELQRDGLAVRLAPGTSAGAGPYALTPAGRSLCALVTSLIGWADRHHGHIAGSRESFDGGSGAGDEAGGGAARSA